MRALGLDVGEKRIGVAISDPLGLVASPLRVIERKAPEEDIRELNGLIKAEGVEVVVVGLPRNMDGSFGQPAEAVLRFCELLREKANVPVETWDERLSTVAANRALLEADLSRAKRRRIVDSTAASLILQGYLDNRLAMHQNR